MTGFPDLSSGLCASGQYDPSHWWPEEKHGGHQDRYEEIAARVCMRCPVQPECLAYVAERNEPAGVWGGVTAKERKAARANARRKGQKGLPFTESVLADLLYAAETRRIAMSGLTRPWREVATFAGAGQQASSEKG